MSLIYLLLIITSPKVWCFIRLEDFKINSYHLTSSSIYNVGKTKREVTVAEPKEFRFNLNLYNDGRPFTVNIRQRNCSVLVEKSVILKIFNSSEATPLDFGKKIYLYEGFVEEFNDSSVNGYIKDNQYFYGHVMVNNSIFYIEEHKDEFIAASKNALVFKKDSVILGIVLNKTKAAKILFEQLLKKNYFLSEFQIWKQNGKLCPIVVVIDHSFLNIIHKKNMDAAIYHVLFSLEEANAIFRSTDLDGDGIPDNIGFYIKKIVLLTDNQEIYFVHEYKEQEIPISDYLLKFMRFHELPYHCLGIVFTAQKFINGTLGASYTPDSTSLYPTSGICDKLIPGFGTLNGLVITASTVRTPLVNQIVFEVTITHELGHSFGSLHDQDQNSSCFGYLMSPKSFNDYYSNKTHMLFSQCSRDHILRTLVIKGDCFEPAETSFCGNGLIEDGEDCDCGLTIDCIEKDPCCVPRRTKDYPCKINKNKGFECHPSQGDCCTKDCKYKENLESFVNCRNFDKSCPCPNNQTNCQCGLKGTCINDNCHSIECTRIGLEECQCEPKLSDKFCHICCQYQNNCMPAIEATSKMSVKKNATIFNVKTRQYVFKRFCSAKKCVTLQFYQGNIGEYCLYKAKLGKCRRDLKCEIFRAKQIYPVFETTSVRSTCINIANCFFNVFIYVLLDFIVIYWMFYFV